jgi:hypothetical protein
MPQVCEHARHADMIDQVIELSADADDGTNERVSMVRVRRWFACSWLLARYARHKRCHNALTRPPQLECLCPMCRLWTASAQRLDKPYRAVMLHLCQLYVCEQATVQAQGQRARQTGQIAFPQRPTAMDLVPFAEAKLGQVTDPEAPLTARSLARLEQQPELVNLGISFSVFLAGYPPEGTLLSAMPAPHHRTVRGWMACIPLTQFVPPHIQCCALPLQHGYTWGAPRRQQSSSTAVCDAAAQLSKRTHTLATSAAG